MAKAPMEFLRIPLTAVAFFGVSPALCYHHIDASLGPCHDLRGSKSILDGRRGIEFLGCMHHAEDWPIVQYASVRGFCAFCVICDFEFRALSLRDDLQLLSQSNHIYEQVYGV